MYCRGREVSRRKTVSDFVTFQYNFVLCGSSSVSSYDKNQAYSTEWSDDEQPAAYSGNENGGNGNSFEDDSSTGKGVRVRALYDYEGQEQDELSFKAGTDRGAPSARAACFQQSLSLCLSALTPALKAAPIAVISK